MSAPRRDPPPMTDPVATGSDARLPTIALLRAAAPVLRRVARPVLAGWLLIAGIAALSPSIGWMGKQVVDGLEAAEFGLAGLLLTNGWAFGLLFTALTMLEIADKPVGKWIESRLVIELQNTYLAARRAAHATDDAALMLYGAEEAKRGLKILIDDVPKLVFTLASVSIWQMALAPEWLPFMMVAVLPAMLWLWVLSRPVQSHALHALDAQMEIAGATTRDRAAHLSSQQGRWMRASIFIDLFKGLGESGLVWMIWASFVTSVLTVLLLVPDSALGRQMSPGEFIVTMVNLGLFVDPLAKLGKIVMHFSQSRPALAHALGLVPNLNEARTVPFRPGSA